MMMRMVGVEVRGRTAGTAFGAFWWRSEVGFGEAGVEAEGVAVPEIDGSVRERGAGAGVEDGDAELERDAGFVFGDVGAEELVGDVEGADFLLGVEGARDRGGEGEGGSGEAEGGGGGDGGGEETAAGEMGRFDGVWPRVFVTCCIGLDVDFGLGTTE